MCIRDSGYYQFHKKLQQLGADVERVDNESKKAIDATTVLA